MRSNFLKSKIFQGTLILTIAGFITRIIGFYYKIFLSRIYHEEGLGIIGLTTPIIILVHSITTGGIQNAITRYAASSKHTNIKKSYCYLFSGMFLSIILSLGFTVITYYFSDFISTNILHEPRCKVLLQILAISFPLAAIHNCINSFFYAFKDTKAPSITMLIEQLTRVATVYILYRYASSVTYGSTLPLSFSCLGILAGECSSSIFSCIFLSSSQKKWYNNTNSTLIKYPLISINETAEIFKMSFPLSLNRIIISLLSTVETTNLPLQLIKSGVDNASALSVYGTFSGMAFPLILFPCAITGAAASLLLPTISESQATGNYKNIKRIFYLTTTICSGLGVACAFLFYIFANFIGENIFSSGLAGSQIRALAFVCPFLYLSGLLTSILHGLGKTTFTFIVNIISVAIRLLFVLYIIPILGFKGYLYGILISQIFICLANYVALKQYIVYNSSIAE